MNKSRNSESFGRTLNTFLSDLPSEDLSKEKPTLIELMKLLKNI